jgi:hypothetical protein
MADIIATIGRPIPKNAITLNNGYYPQYLPSSRT